MTKTKIALASLLALSLCACAKSETAAPAADAGKIADAVKADADQLAAQLNAKDLDKAVAHDAPDIVVMFHGAPNTKTADEDKAVTKTILTDPAFHLTLSDATVDVAKAGDMAIYRSSYTVTQTDPKTKKVGTETGNMLAVYKPQADGSWKIAQQVISDTPAGATAAPAPAAAPAAPPAKK
jgi:ketosteroid isomerase-like protein